MFSILEAPDKQDEPNSRLRTVLRGPEALTEWNRAYGWSSIVNIATSETGSYHILVRIELSNCRKYATINLV
jgi:hypothetical protein